MAPITPESPEERHVPEDVITFRKAFKSYGRGDKACHVLQDFDMTVKQSNVYALLGASGCGKTTVLSCVVGHIPLDSGEVRIFGRKPNTKDSGVPGPLVGYMAQDKGLSLQVKVGELLYYFGRLYGMTPVEIHHRISFLLKLLQLPPKTKYIYTLSGGQQKRLSFAIALIHEPKLLILDEPTVGVDPILRKMIWTYLHKLTSGGTTIVITTHYIEEARKAHMVGLLRNGRLLAQQNPTDLMQQYSAKTLEEVFLKLCCSDEEQLVKRQSQSRAKQQKPSVSEEEEEKLPILFEQKSSSWDRIKAIIEKNCKRLYHDYLPPVMFINLAPVIMLAVVIALGGNPRAVNVAVVNHEWPQEPICQPFGDCFFYNLSCMFLQGIDRNIITLVPYETEAQALAAVHDGQAAGMVTFPANYSDGIANRLIEGLRVDNTSIANSIADMRMDMSNYHVALLTQRAFLLRYSEMAHELSALCGSNELLTASPIKFDTPIYGRENPDFLEFIGPGVFINALFGIMLIGCAAFFLWEKEDGMLERIIVAGVKEWELLVAQTVTQIFFVLYVVIVMMLIMYVAVVPVNHTMPWVFLLAFLQGICATMLALYLGTVLPRFTTALVAFIAVLIYNHIMSGILWPLEGVPYEFMKWLCYLNPNTWANEGSRSMVTRGTSLYDKRVIIGFATTLGWTAVFFIMTMIAMRRFRGSLVQH